MLEVTCGGTTELGDFRDGRLMRRRCMQNPSRIGFWRGGSSGSSGEGVGKESQSGSIVLCGGGGFAVITSHSPRSRSGGFAFKERGGGGFGI